MKILGRGRATRRCAVALVPASIGGVPIGPDGGGMADVPVVVVVGAACRDLVHDDPRGWRLGGGVTYAALTLGPARAAGRAR